MTSYKNGSLVVTLKDIWENVVQKTEGVTEFTVDFGLNGSVILKYDITDLTSVQKVSRQERSDDNKTALV